MDIKYSLILDIYKVKENKHKTKFKEMLQPEQFYVVFEKLKILPFITVRCHWITNYRRSNTSWFKQKGKALAHMAEKFWCNVGIGGGSVQRLNMSSRLGFSFTLSLELALFQVGFNFNHMLLCPLTVRRGLKQLMIMHSLRFKSHLRKPDLGSQRSQQQPSFFSPWLWLGHVTIPKSARIKNREQ